MKSASAACAIRREVPISQIAVANSYRSLAGSLRQREITGFPVACRRTSSRACWSAQPAGPVPADETPHPARGHIQAEPVVGPAQRVPQMLGLGRGDRQRLPLRPPVTEVEGVLGARAAAAGPPPSTPPPPPASARPDVLNLAGTTPFECTICTAVAPLAVFTVRT